MNKVVGPCSLPNNWTAASITTWEKFRWLNIDENVCQKTFSWNAATWCSISQILFNSRLHQQGNACFFVKRKKKKFVIMNTLILTSWFDHWFHSLLWCDYICQLHSSVRIHTPVWIHWPAEDWFSSLKTRKNGNFKWALGSSSIAVEFLLLSSRQFFHLQLLRLYFF